ncbi:MAG: hypothetical protein K8R64_08220 [Methanosarcinaceae archaeon]|nr:hypothetical protein [Methanosarcinaceae archaeon]
MKSNNCDREGPAGSTAATYATRAGASFLLVDRNKDIGVPLQCGGFLSYHKTLQGMMSSAQLPYTLEEYPSSYVHTTTTLHHISIQICHKISDLIPGPCVL